MTYSIDFRSKTLEIKEKCNFTYEEAAAHFGIGIASLVRWNNKLEPQETRDKLPTKINNDDLLGTGLV